MVTFKGRYLLAKVHFSDRMIDRSMKASHIQDALAESLKTHFGMYGQSFSGMVSVKYWNYETNHVIVRAPFYIYKMIWAAMSLITELDGRKALFEVLHLGGTLKSCKKQGIKIEDKYTFWGDETDDEQQTETDNNKQQTEETEQPFESTMS